MKWLFFINFIFSLMIIFFQRKNAATAWAWILVVNFIPVAGFLIYLTFGQNFHKEKIFRNKEIEGEIESAARRQSTFIRREGMGKYHNLILYNLNAEGSVLTDNNDVQIFTDGQSKFQALIEDLKTAKNYIHLQYYIIRQDHLWERIENILLEKVQQGVEVRILYDSIGCRSFRKEEFQKLKSQGIQTAEFFPALFGKLHLRINYRNHRKIVIIDGRVGYLGGFNIGREYLGEEEKFGYWRDTHLRMEGAAVTSLAVRFVLDWNYAAKENLFLKDSLFEMPVYEREGDVSVQIISSGPDSKAQEIRNNYLRLIHLAEKSIFIQTPYFIPDENIRDALIIAASSGIEVKIMIPCKPDHPFVYWATHAHIGEMIEAGVTCYCYQNGFLHTKCLCVDGETACIGTANMDIRSFALNFEVNAVVYNEPVVQKLEEAFLKDVNYSREITEYTYANRSLKVRLKEQFCRLLSPVL